MHHTHSPGRETDEDTAGRLHALRSKIQSVFWIYAFGKTRRERIRAATSSRASRSCSRARSRRSASAEAPPREALPLNDLLPLRLLAAPPSAPPDDPSAAIPALCSSRARSRRSPRGRGAVRQEGAESRASSKRTVANSCSTASRRYLCARRPAASSERPVKACWRALARGLHGTVRQRGTPPGVRPTVDRPRFARAGALTCSRGVRRGRRAVWRHAVGSARRCHCRAT